MKKKFRIKEIDGNFYPQYKKLFFWTGFEGEPYPSYGVPEFATADGVFYGDAYFDTLEKAQRFIDDHEKKLKITYHI